MQFNDAQLQAITSEKALILVSAGAGSGKTRVLTERIIHLCELRFQNPNHPVGAMVDEIVAITFTEKAAREMKDRIRKRIAEKESEAREDKERLYWSEQKEAMERAHISTFHSFCQRLLSQHAMAADLIPRSRVIDDVEARGRKRTILINMLQEKEFHEIALPLLQVMSKNQLFESIEQVHNDVREFIVGEQAIETLQVEHMIQIQREAKQKEQIDIVRGFHEKATKCVQEFPPLDDLTKAQRAHAEKIILGFENLEMPEDPNEYMTNVTNIMPSRSDKRWAEKAPAMYELYTEHWKPLKDRWSDLGGEVVIQQEIIDLLERVTILIKEFSRRYNDEKKRGTMLDFSDLQQKAVALLENETIKKACQRQFRHMMVDEFQDTNQLQLEMLDRIEPAYQFIVGDQKQSIYRFRGANVSLMNEREDQAKNSSDGEVILMNQNYRTTAPVIEAVNELFSNAMADVRTKPYETVYAALEPNREGEKEEEKRVEFMILEKEGEQELSQYDILANRIVEMIQTGSPHIHDNESWSQPRFSDMAILIPARSHLLSLERSLMNKNVPYVVNGGVGFYERQEILDFITLLKWLNRPFEELHLLALLRSPMCGLTVNDFISLKNQLGENELLYQLVYDESHPSLQHMSIQIQDACSKVRGWLDEWTPFRIMPSLEQTLHAVFLKTGLRTSLMLQANGLQKVRNVEKLIQIIVESRQTNLETIVMELEDRILLSEKEGESEVERVDGDFVQIMTVHASKGLEFPIVFLPQLERQIRGDKGSIRFHQDLGIVMNIEEEPDQMDEETILYQTPGFSLVKETANAEAREEAKRLFYVAMTRARDYLFMVGEESKTPHTWLALTNEALDQTNLAEKLEVLDHIHEQQPVSREKERYFKPKLLTRKDVPLTLSVSEIMLFMKDPVTYYKRYVIGLPDTSDQTNDVFQKSESSKGINASVLGTIVHRACELRDNGLTNEAAIREAIREQEEQGEDLSNYVTEINGFMSSYTEDRKDELGETIETEWNFITNIEGVEIIGEIDKVTIKDGKRHIVDFKTNRISRSGSELLDSYWPQLYLYKLAYEQETNCEVDSMSLFVFRDQDHPVHTLQKKEEEEAMVRKAIRTIGNLRRREASKADFEAIAMQ
ncbi:UvrD-helicase domain-containing protein [Alkalihalobacillus sp. MEB130]|uniref:UvrD-helicase domain-containing protein n=1 Tax=Alkalihalobacillus sp. MEB130 TaxID=2976704 RepID=UPI0028DDEFA0|nr:UvrD-helicase domain-containing protein [Alkalihalobacillus sp. MEB130]MDT8859564.1 UvrD-helicase domain-containing protein [Alkalihalobacillus sp. MEB130]